MTGDPNPHANKKHPEPDEKIRPTGPHDKPELTDPEKAPGTGILPDQDQPDVEGPTG